MKGPEAVVEPGAQVHPTALIGPGSVVQEGAVVGPWAVLEAGVRVGPRSVIGPHARVGQGVELGPRCVVDAGAHLGGPTRQGEAPGRLTVGEGCHIGEYARIEAASGLVTAVGDGAFIMARTRIGAGARLERGVVVTNHSSVGEGARLGAHVVLGGFSAVAPGLCVGRRAMVGAFSRVTVDVPPFLLVDGDPLRLYDINRVGLRRDGTSAEAREALRRAVRVLFRSATPLEAALARLAGDAGRFDEVRELVAFVTERPDRLPLWRQSEGSLQQA